MSEVNMFEVAVKNKFRFESKSGLLSVEDLYDLPLTGRNVNLDDVAKAVHKQLKNSEEESFVLEKTSSDKELELKLSIVKYIIAEKKADAAEKANAAKVKAQKQKIMEIIEQKENNNLAEMSIEELKALL